MKRLNLIITLLSLLPAYLSAGEKQLQTLNLKVEHLACESCAEKFKSELLHLCKDLALDPKNGEAVCRYESPVTPEQILKKAKKTGLPTEIISKNAM